MLMRENDNVSQFFRKEWTDHTKKEQRNRAVGFAGAIVLFSILFLLSAGGRQPAAAAQTQVMEGTGESKYQSGFALPKLAASTLKYEKAA